MLNGIRRWLVESNVNNPHRWYTKFLISCHLTLVGCKVERLEPYGPYPLSTPAKGRLTCCHVVAGQARGVIISTDIQNHFSSLALARYQGGAPNDRIRSALLRHSRDGPPAALGFSRPKKNLSDGRHWGGSWPKRSCFFPGPHQILIHQCAWHLGRAQPSCQMWPSFETPRLHRGSGLVAAERIFCSSIWAWPSAPSR
ncbi:hypothetical protein F5144DRAFT_211741 [Chaetomium tenue]|uniref:Uncharacterized protein n=1 Tax=Chaetomium tenue TaxID=1854479 RepID=A0ACB7PI62_9PEZI|nr:hypothetical protein F5144DRAFT_211741 [Chaetomium globosum]